MYRFKTRGAASTLRFVIHSEFLPVPRQPIHRHLQRICQAVRFDDIGRQTLGIGLFISTISNTQQEALLTATFTMLPSIFLSGFFFPLAAMPTVLQWISYAIPLRYFLIVVRGIILKGVGVEALWPEVIALSIFAVVIMGSAALRFRKRLD